LGHTDGRRSRPQALLLRPGGLRPRPERGSQRGVTPSAPRLDPGTLAVDEAASVLQLPDATHARTARTAHTAHAPLPRSLPAPPRSRSRSAGGPAPQVHVVGRKQGVENLGGPTSGRRTGQHTQHTDTQAPGATGASCIGEEELQEVLPCRTSTGTGSEQREFRQSAKPGLESTSSPRSTSG